MTTEEEPIAESFNTTSEETVLGRTRQIITIPRVGSQAREHWLNITKDVVDWDLFILGLK